jgi:hypothetical protein
MFSIWNGEFAVLSGLRVVPLGAFQGKIFTFTFGLMKTLHGERSDFGYETFLGGDLAALPVEHPLRKELGPDGGLLLGNVRAAVLSEVPLLEMRISDYYDLARVLTLTQLAESLRVAKEEERRKAKEAEEAREKAVREMDQSPALKIQVLEAQLVQERAKAARIAQEAEAAQQKAILAQFRAAQAPQPAA